MWSRFFLGLLASRDSLKCCEFSKNSKKSFFRFFPGLLGSRDSLNVANFRKILKSRFSHFSRS
ncbi:hypothetical protein T11_11783 [Trichinella zimbabwensis]|uniref:Uncharacterized protein n=1 Tax=Trichinella zimbabwensis TaxID=268475 RepID=A0A0V1GBR6_9BILA|nr:hypothetical protein T11_11783 [Trichinella zimbabwensis]